MVRSRPPKEVAELLETITVPTEHRYLQLMRAIWGGATERQVFAATKIDPWFVKQMFLINETAMTVREAETLTAEAAQEGEARRSVRRAGGPLARFG